MPGHKGSEAVLHLPRKMAAAATQRPLLLLHWGPGVSTSAAVCPLGVPCPLAQHWNTGIIDVEARRDYSDNIA